MNVFTKRFQTRFQSIMLATPTRQGVFTGIPLVRMAEIRAEVSLAFLNFPIGIDPNRSFLF